MDCVRSEDSLTECNGDKGTKHIRCDAVDRGRSFRDEEGDDEIWTGLESTKVPSTFPRAASLAAMLRIKRRGGPLDSFTSFSPILAVKGRPPGDPSIFYFRIRSAFVSCN